MPSVLDAVPFVPWAEFSARWPRLYAQDHHVSIVGPTGSGKTVLAHQLHRPRAWRVVMATKPRDGSMERLIKADGFEKVTRWPPRKVGKDNARFVLWPKAEGLVTGIKAQQFMFRQALDSIYRDGSWAIHIDEAYVFADLLQLRQEMRTLWTQGRAMRISMMALAQRPAWVPREMWTEARHYFIFNTGDEADLRKIGSFNGVSARLVADITGSLRDHEWLYVNAQTRAMVRSILPNPNNRKAHA